MKFTSFILSFIMCFLIVGALFATSGGDSTGKVKSFSECFSDSADIVVDSENDILNPTEFTNCLNKIYSFTEEEENFNEVVFLTSKIIVFEKKFLPDIEGIQYKI